VKRSIVICGSVAQKPQQGGHTWVFLQYVLGFRRLGWDVLFLDRLDASMCRDAAGKPAGVESSANLVRFLEVMARFDLNEAYSLMFDNSSRSIGRSRTDVIEFTARADCLINFMGFLADEEILSSAKRRVFFDIDPGFPQMWKDLGLADLFAGHDAFVTIGENIGRVDCQIPTCGLHWITTPQPVVLDEWPTGAESPRECFTAIATWRGAYGPVEYHGKSYGLRVHEFRKFFELPMKTAERFEIALDIHADETADLSRLRDNGWSVIDPRRTASDPCAYRAYVQSSKAELMIAKNMYVESRGGWFSDRSICYLASGRPVLAQDTGFSDNYPVGTGLVAFTTLQQAVEGARAITADYAKHSRAAREIAEQCFNSDIVLTRLLEKLGLS
jgi:hypothetical protein